MHDHQLSTWWRTRPTDRKTMGVLKRRWKGRRKHHRGTRRASVSDRSRQTQDYGDGRMTQPRVEKLEPITNWAWYKKRRYRSVGLLAFSSCCSPLPTIRRIVNYSGETEGIRIRFRPWFATCDCLVYRPCDPGPDTTRTVPEKEDVKHKRTAMMLCGSKVMMMEKPEKNDTATIKSTSLMSHE